MSCITVSNIKIDYKVDSIEMLLSKACKKCRIKSSDIDSFKILKKSIDARHKPEVFYVYQVFINTKNKVKKVKHKDIIYDKNLKVYKLPKSGSESLRKRPVIVGFGPCGLYCAYILAKCGFKPLIIERGEDIDNRSKTVESFWNGDKLNTESNVQFGEGGAGTFSDGKLNTGVSDKFGRLQYILETFHEYGADENITYDSKPHIGTDVLKECIRNMREEIKSLGGEIMFNTRLDDIKIEDGKVKSIILSDNTEVECECLVLALGHSARDTFYMLNDYLKMERKTYAVGLRIIHPQSVINMGQYGTDDERLESAPYKLTYKSDSDIPVFSFCMCPGGYVVNASSEENKLAINGMSYKDRNSGCANSALVSHIETDVAEGSDVLANIEYQRGLEEKTYNLCNGKIPAQKYIDFKNDVKTESFADIGYELKVKGEYEPANIRSVLPDHINKIIIEAVEYFGNKLSGFSMDNAVLLAIESRTSSPIRILRDENFESEVKGIYPAGEGCGYAGGIMSAAADGIKIAEAIVNKFTNKDLEI